MKHEYVIGAQTGGQWGIGEERTGIDSRLLIEGYGEGIGQYLEDDYGFITNAGEFDWDCFGGETI